MSATGTPKQGDHVFNAIETAIMRPFETIRSLSSALVDGQHFLHDCLVHSYSMARKMADAPELVLARTLVASAGAEDGALREITNLRSRYPTLARIGPPLLSNIHLRNSEQFGAAAGRFEVEMLAAVQQSLEKAVTPAATRPSGGRTPSPSIAFQQMLGAAYDPAAALVVVVSSMSREAPPIQATFYSAIVGIAETLDRPGMWKDPYARFREDRPSTTGKKITDIRSVLMRIDLLNAQSAAFPTMIKDEIAEKARSPHTDNHFWSDAASATHAVAADARIRRVNTRGSGAEVTMSWGHGCA